MIDSIQINKLSKLHNKKNIRFCKTDYLLSEFEYIKTLNYDIILISGNSDYAITDDIINIAPKNIKKWYAQNALVNNPILEPIPIGLENQLPSLREGHGIGYGDRVIEREKIFAAINSKKKIPNKFIYANFNINTNVNHRLPVKDICLSTDFILWQEPNLTINDFFNQILDHKMIVCPAGNGVDTHRLWEVLYCDRVPIIIKLGPYKIYELYKQLPIIILDSIEKLKDYNFLINKYNLIKSNLYNKNLLSNKYWINKIQNP